MLKPLVLLLLLSLEGSTSAIKAPGMEPPRRADMYSIAFGSNSHRIIPTIQVFISSVESFPVSFEVMTLLGYSHRGIVLPNSSTTVTIRSSYELTSLHDKDKGISITTDAGSITVVGLNYYNLSTDGFLALPCTLLDTDSYEYYGLTYHSKGLPHPGFVLVVACDDATEVNYGPSTTILNKLETLYLQDPTDYSGTRVKSTKPVSFFSGHSCTYVPSGVQYCEHLVEQIPPTAVWGTYFLSASYFSRSSGELYKILTASNSTTVTVNCNTFSQPQTFSLTSAGSWTEFTTDFSSLCSIESSSPLLVMEFSLGYAADGIGDPFMMMIPSVDQYVNDYIFHSPSEFTNYITILVTPQYYQPEQILVDGVSQENANWTPIHCANGSACGYRAYVTLEPGGHHVWHSDSCAKMSVLMYGFADKVSYGQPAGISMGIQVLHNISYSVLEDDPHSVRFTWSPPPEQEQSERIIHYTIKCVSEKKEDGMIVNQTTLRTIILTFIPATHYICSLSASTVCGEGPHSAAISLLTTPAAVEGLTMIVRGNELLVHWNNSVRVVSHYIVYVVIDGKEKLQLSSLTHELKYESEVFRGYGTIEVQVFAVNDAGIGPSATVTIPFGNRMQGEGQGSNVPLMVGGSVTAVVVVTLVVIVVVVLILVWGKKYKFNQNHPQNVVHQTNPIYNQPQAEAYLERGRTLSNSDVY